MPEDRIIDLKTVIGVYPISNTGAVLVHRIDYTGDLVQASINGVNPVWTELKEQYVERTGEMELGFFLDQLFVPFCEIMRFHQ